MKGQPLSTVPGRVKWYINMLFHAPGLLKLLSERADRAEEEIRNNQQELLETKQEFLRVDQERQKADQHLQDGLAELGSRIEPLERADTEYLRLLIQRISEDYEGMLALNRCLSNCPTVWGDPRRLHISPLAAVHPCLFNTNSGDITIGDYSFAGSRVSILAGSHDKRLTGFLRREASLAEGCDIVIGKGVWLGSGCTLLGPCTVGDHAVIAAGAVVVPGTDVPSNTVYGGIPARKIGEIDLSEDVQKKAIQEALERNHGAPYTEDEMK